MEERFPDDFVTWHHKTFVGIKVDEIFGMDSKNGKVWAELARQIYCEQGEPNYRIINHFENGAPYLEGSLARISLTHTNHFFAVASLPKTPETDLYGFNPRTAMGIDAESIDREQVIKVRNKFLSEQELSLVHENDLEANILAWTSKEAIYKTAFQPGLDFRNSIIIKKLPLLNDDPIKSREDSIGKAYIIFPQETGIERQEMNLFSYKSYNCCVTLAFSPKCAKFGK